jgi:hypothetical protein
MTRAEELMEMCLIVVKGENIKTSEKCAGVGPGIFTPVGAARAYSACAVAMFNAFTPFDDKAIPLGNNVSVPTKVQLDQRTLANKQDAITASTFEVLQYLLPNRRAEFTNTMNTYFGLNFNVTLPYYAQLGSSIGIEFVQNVLQQDRSNQAGCYADISSYSLVNPNIVLDNFTTVLASRNRQRDITQWSDARVGTNIPAGRSYLLPHAGLMRAYSCNPSDFFLVPSAMKSRDLDAEMRNLTKIGADLNTDGGKKKLIAELFADGPASTLPPGHWQEIAIELVARRLGYDLDQAIRLLTFTGVAVYDAGIACWAQKRMHNSIRPFAYIPLMMMNETLPNQFRGAYCPHGDIMGYEWQPYQAKGFYTPPFPEFPSGHSTFSAASAFVISKLLGSDSIPRGPYHYTIAKGGSLFESYCGSNGLNFKNESCSYVRCDKNLSFDSANNYLPSSDTILGPYNTFSDLADEAGISRLYGGIHITSGDYGGRALGRKVGNSVTEYLCAHNAWEGCSAPAVTNSIVYRNAPAPSNAVGSWPVEAVVIVVVIGAAWLITTGVLIFMWVSNRSRPVVLKDSAAAKTQVAPTTAPSAPF